MIILFLHGWQSTPGGVKPTYLKDHGHDVLNPAISDDSFDEAVRVTQAAFDRGKPDVVVGSSRGGAVAMNIEAGDTPLVLLCPAWKFFGAARKVKPGTLILHSPADDTVPFADSQELIRISGLPEAALVVVGTDHRLADPEPLEKMLEAVENAAKQLGKKPKVRIGWRRLFGILLGATAAYAVPFFGFWQSNAGGIIVINFVVLFIAVGLAQKLLYRGERPLNASAAIGASFFLSLYVFYHAVNLVSYVLTGKQMGAMQMAPHDPIEALVFGAVFGFLVGLPIAGLSWLADKAIDLWRKGFLPG